MGLFGKSFKLGDRVRDRVSGFEGIAVANYNYLNGCVRIEVQPKINEKGELPEPRVFDHNQIERVEKEAFKADADLVKTGGPASSKGVAR